MKCVRGSSRSADWNSASRRRESVNGRENLKENGKESVNARKSGSARRQVQTRTQALHRLPEGRRSKEDPETERAGITGIIADLADRAGRLITTIRGIAKAVALVQALTGAAAVLTALEEAMADRTIDLRKIMVRRALCLKPLPRMRRSTERKRNAG